MPKYLTKLSNIAGWGLSYLFLPLVFIAEGDTCSMGGDDGYSLARFAGLVILFVS